ncbi:MAG: adenine nucleotide alpha hydrolase [Acidimicrobiia bacterium]|nr:adenine nucleotide alpha hydrolase [Acidimicrobiia bacterium]MDX2466530.1 adenine nucleotide alpha hydrolase [Acidimicrobiia bacterium]
MNRDTFHTELVDVLESMGPVAVAVSGGIDSLTLAAVSHAVFGNDFVAFHAVSAAVPPRATERIARLANRFGWPLQVVDAGEFENDRYLANEVNRCYHCKSSLYGRIAESTELQIVSGANTDDLRDFRPGLAAAAERSVRHPFVEAGISKDGIRAIAREVGLGSIAEIPAAPCLASRLETGITVTPTRLRFVDEVEELARELLSPDTVRCRVFAERIEIQLDPVTLDSLHEDAAAKLTDYVAGREQRPVAFTPYRMGSAVVHQNG